MSRSILPIVLTFIFITVPVTSSHAAEGSQPLNNCHCFRDRTFNPENKFISDDYILTTTFNSLLASEFNIPKRDIIMMKMRDGVANNDLLTALYLSRDGGLQLAQLLQLRKEKTWKAIIDPLITEKTPDATREAFRFITAGTSDEKIAEEITHRLITSRFPPLAQSLDMLSKEGMDPREIILAFTLADHTGVPVQQITEQFLKNGRSWSEIAYNFGLEPGDVGKLLETPKAVKTK